MDNNTKPLDISSLSNAADLEYFIALQEAKLAAAPDYSTEKWNRRAELWNKERVSNRKRDERVVSTMAYLEQKGLLQSSYDVADIGCGPGRFAASFAKRVHHVVGLDISEKMVAHGMEHLKNEGITNAVLRTCDFQTLDIEKEGYKEAFDLVFSSMTPAIHGMNGLLKSMEMSRGWCLNITHLSGRNLLREQLMQEVFGKKVQQRWTGRWFYSLFNILFLLGYQPETSYEKQHQQIWTSPDEEYAEFMMEHMLPQEEMTKENFDKILKWLLAHQNEEGLILEITDASFGRILWDVRNRTERPDYQSEN